MGERFVTLAIHTSEHAMALKRILESHGIEVRLQRLVLSGSIITAGVRVRINEKDLPIALRITESIERISSPGIETTLSGQHGDLLIPIDFQDYCMLACKTGFDLAARLNLRPVLLHAFPTPYFSSSFSLDDNFDGDIENNTEQEIVEVEAGKDLRNRANRQLKDLTKEIDRLQKEEKLPKLKFKTVLEGGVAEDVIKDYCRVNPPAIVVMATRGKKKKGEQLIGSVTAEVLDDCKVPVFSIPEDFSFTAIDNIKKLVFFCNLDQHDLISVDTFMRMFDYPEVEITLIPLYVKSDKNIQNKLSHLKDYFNKSYPAAHFRIEIFPSKTFMLEFTNYESQAGIEMLVVPNRRRNAFMRIFNPGIAHRLLFERDLPLLALPV